MEKTEVMAVLAALATVEGPIGDGVRQTSIANLLALVQKLDVGPRGAETPPKESAETRKVKEALESLGGSASTAQLIKATKLDKIRIRQALTALRQIGRVVLEGERRAARYTITH